MFITFRKVEISKFNKELLKKRLDTAINISWKSYRNEFSYELNRICEEVCTGLAKVYRQKKERNRKVVNDEFYKYMRSKILTKAQTHQTTD